METSAVDPIMNEVDVDAKDYKLRTLVEFEMVDEQGRMVHIEDIGKSKSKKIYAAGCVIEPLTIEQRDILQKYASSCPGHKDDKDDKDIDADGPSKHKDKEEGNNNMELEGANANGAGKSVKLSDKEAEKAIAGFDSRQLAVGSAVDAYCNRTYKWFNSKIIQVKADEVKVHYGEWNSKFDDWIDRGSSRLAAVGTSDYSAKDAAKMESKMIPWFETSKLYEKLAEETALPNIGYSSGEIGSSRRKEAVKFEAVDWCIDLSYSNPSIWIISADGAWYRLAGMLCPYGTRGWPSPKYHSTFTKFRVKFEVCAHVAMCLLDFYPTNPGINLQDVISEVISRTKSVSESLILEHWKLINEQISALSFPEDWDPRLKPFHQSPFVSDLRKLGQASHDAGKSKSKI